MENEPAVRPDIRDMADIATPHIADIFEGKAFGTDIITGKHGVSESNPYGHAMKILNAIPRLRRALTTPVKISNRHSGKP